MNTNLDAFDGKRVAVIGDLMLDAYLAGDVRRISPEAPVPVVRVSSEKVVPGGAANVAVNLASLGLKVGLVGLTGADAARDALLAALDTWPSIETRGIVTAADRPTTRKLRVIGAHQQIVRVDHEEALPPTREIEARLIAAASDAILAAEIVVVSDYGKGVCSDAVLRHVMALAQTLGRLVIVDPKRTDFSAYHGAAVLTPNRKELTDACWLPCETDAEASAAARRAQEICAAAIVLTRSEKGMSLFPVGGDPTHLATVAQDVFDVSGAGDTVIAVLAAGMVAGLSLSEAMRMANHAAGIVVSKVGTAAVTREELGMALLAGGNASAGDGELVDLDQAVALRASWGRAKLTVGIANGCFDLLHPGHIALIRQAADSCDRLIMALNSDASVRRLKGPKRPIQNESARALVIGAIKGVAAVLLFQEDTPLEIIRALRPDVLVKGADYSVDRVVGAELVLAGGGRVILAQLEPDCSTTALVAAAR